MQRWLLPLILAFLPRLSSGEEEAPWPPVDPLHIVAYCYDATQEKGREIVTAEGKHHRGIVVPFTRNLMASKHAKLSEILNGAPSSTNVSPAAEFLPQHALVFYDENWQPVAWLSLSLPQQTLRAHPPLEEAGVDFAELTRFLQKLGLPVGQDEDFSVLFRNYHSVPR